MTDWSNLAEWWEDEVAADPAYRAAVIPLIGELLPTSGVFIDLGCGEGQVMGALSTHDRVLVGCDVSSRLSTRAARHGPVVRADLPDLRWARPGSVDGCLAVLVIEHLDDLATLFGAAADVTRAGGVFALVANHPYVTAPRSASVVDPTDGEVFWRWGDYLSEGTTVERAGEGTVAFHHRPVSGILNAAAAEGWQLRHVREREIPAGADDLPHAGLPRLLGVAWERTA